MREITDRESYGDMLDKGNLEHVSILVNKGTNNPVIVFFRRIVVTALEGHDEKAVAEQVVERLNEFDEAEFADVTIDGVQFLVARQPEWSPKKVTSKQILETLEKKKAELQMK